MRDVTGDWMKTVRAAALVFCALLAGCAGGGGGGGGSTCASSTVDVSIEPAAPTVIANTPQPFVATVTGVANTAVDWSVQEDDGGDITPTGVYTAPASPGTYHVTATSQADSCGTATVEVTVAQAQPITVTISPAGPVTVELQGSQTFLATVTGTTNTAVTWSVQDGGAGEIKSDTGVYTAPTTLPMNTVAFVVATSDVDPTISDRVEINIVESTPVLISPSKVTIGLGGQVQFSLSNLAGGEWSLNGDSTFGTINIGTGLYMAPFQMPASNTVIEVSQASAENTAVVTLARRFLDPETLQVDGCVPQCPADQPNAIVAEDFNGDGLDDLATANSGTGTISLLIAADKSHFDVPYRYTVGDADTSEPQALAVADLNFDGNLLDLAIADALLGGPAVRTRLGEGDGTFGDEYATSLPSDRTPLSIAIGFLDSDPYLDVAVANLQNSTIDILRGMGDGTFQLINTLTQIDGVSGPVSIASANFNSASDSFDDLAVANSTDGTVAVFLSNGDGSFVLQSIQPVVGSAPTAVAAVMLSGDNYPDLVVTTFVDDGNTVASDLTILMNTADPGRFATRFMLGDTIATGFKPVAVATGDFNKDAVPDVVVANEGDDLVPGDDVVTTYFFDPSQDTLVQSEIYTVGELPKGLTVGDFNGDGWDDVAVANSNDDTVSILRNRGGPTAPAP